MNIMIMEQFYQKEVLPLLTSQLNVLEEEYQKQKNEWKESFLNAVDLAFKQMNEQNSLPVEPCYFMVQQLRTRILRRDYRYIFNLYGEKWFLEENYLLGNWDVGFIFHYFDEMWIELLLRSQKYVMKISAADVEYVMLDIIEEFEKYIVKLLRDTRNDMVELESYKNAKKGNLFMIQCGGYFEICKTIHRELKDKDETSLINMLTKKLQQDTYQFRDFRNMNFSNIKLDHLDLLYCDFAGSNLSGTQFKRILLMGARFNRSDLTDTIFCECNLNKVDFRQAFIKQTSFENTYLHGAIFLKSQLSETNLDEEQLKTIHIVNDL